MRIWLLAPTWYEHMTRLLGVKIFNELPVNVPRAIGILHDAKKYSKRECLCSQCVSMFSRAYSTSCLVMGVFFCVSYFLVRTPHFIVLSWAYSTTNVFSYGCNFLCDLFSSTNKAMRYVVEGVVILYVCTCLLCACNILVQWRSYTPLP